MMSQTTPPEEITYFYLVTFSDKGIAATAAELNSVRLAINTAVQAEGGTCRLFSTHGSAYDRVSIVTGVSPAAAIRIAAAIGQNGHARVKKLPGCEMFK
jgi:uncharacterized protein with GYD domain